MSKIIQEDPYVSNINVENTLKFRETLIDYDVWDCFVFEMPRFQELLRMKTPIPYRLTIPYWDSQMKKEVDTPLIHFIVRRDWSKPVKLLVKNYPDFDFSVTNHEGLSIFQNAIKRGRISTFAYLISTLSFDPHEVTVNNETWLDLANQLPLYDHSFFEDNIDICYRRMRNYIIDTIAPQYDISANFPLSLEVIDDLNFPNSLMSIQARIMQTNKNYIPVLPQDIIPEHRYLFYQDVPEDLHISQFVVFDKCQFNNYDPETYRAYEQLVRLLVEEVGLDINMIDERGNNVLSTVVLMENIQLFEYFVEKGVNPLIINHSEQTLIHYAAQGPNTYFPMDYLDLYLKRLLDLGIDINALDGDGYTAYTRLKSYNCQYGMDYKELEQYGADPSIGIQAEEGQRENCVG
ncbi:MAG: ankyrin repeat domain-containing protein [Brevinema sp.]